MDKKEMKVAFEELINELIDKKLTKESHEDSRGFSKFVGMNNTVLAIKGKKLLKSFPGGSIWWDDDSRSHYNGYFHTERVHMSDLKEGDVFCQKLEGKLKLQNFKIFVGKEKDGEYVSQYLSDMYGLEHIQANGISEDIEVIRFKRD